ncbi:hypothetical protein AVEN_215510-1 [Araneus ventricosus]|uniref:Uncharacterized protein n=1 Tax=Araneus ventricosus TaxID=182803 RepID=A0A4Y2BGS8_ARAVE|nr:hypothetical protein AVEN_215510-1 [Araneus ventricosus]
MESTLKSQKNWYTCLILSEAPTNTQKCHNTMWHGLDWCLKVSWRQFTLSILQGSSQIHRSERWWISLLNSTLQGIPDTGCPTKDSLILKLNNSATEIDRRTKPVICLV